VTNSLARIYIGNEFRLGPAPGSGISSITAYQTPAGFISAVLPNVYTVLGIILLLVLIIGGFSFIAGASKDNQELIEKGKKTISAALTGFLIIFTSYWIIQIIETITGIAIFNTSL